jgi:FKBP-type peptidyl-prolyl cis-trans isomerase
VRHAALALLLAAASLLPFAASAHAEDTPPIPADGAAPVTRPSGLVYSVLQEGRGGASPKSGDAVTVHYTGWLTNGQVFDSSRQRGQPATFPVGGLIAAWNEALTLMTPGSRWKLTVPPALGYGPGGSPPAIPGNATLIFDVELISFRGTPAFRPGDAAKQTTSPTGLVTEVLEAGAGPQATLADVVELDFALWTTAGRLLDYSGRAGGQTLKQPAADLPLAFLKEAVAQMRVGTRLWLKVPPELAFGGQAQGRDLPAHSITIWELALLAIQKPLPCPPFALSAPGAAKKLPSGLEIEILAEGSGASPRLHQPVTVHYAGWLTDGTLFDSSYGRGEPTTFVLGQVIAGWNEGLQLLKVGGKARLTIPGNLAYGPSGRMPKIGPNATLVFVIELLKVGG